VEISPELLGECRIPSDAFVEEVSGGRLRPPGQRSLGVTRYLISFPSGVMDFPEEEGPEVARAAHGVVQEAKDAGVYLFELNGGFTVVDVPTREAALEWAAKIAVACRCAQEVREFMFDPLV
jgi:hypothetical protein